jgi:predicted GIY-YIG superfamily endonuclease
MTVNEWKYCQNNSDFILISGLTELKKNKRKNFESDFENGYGNYLISDKKNLWNYTGEAKNLSKRLKQHSKEKTSTFYKNYSKFAQQNGNLKKLIEISDFDIRTINTTIGRKELEEFGIVNIPANLNKFQLGKRDLYKNKANKKLWTDIQLNKSQIIEQGEKELKKAKRYDWFSAQIKSSAGLYWVEHKTKGLIYIGESSDINKRYETHSGRTYFSALRRNLGETILGFKLQTINGRKRYFSDIEDRKITEFLKNCSIKTLPISFGRFELEEYLIRKNSSILNRKDNK